MVRQHSGSQSPKSIAAAVLAVPGFVVVAGKLDELACPLFNFLGGVAREMLLLLPTLLPAAWQIVQAFAFDHPVISSCPLEMLVSFWPLLHVIAGAA